MFVAIFSENSLVFGIKKYTFLISAVICYSQICIHFRIFHKHMFQYLCLECTITISRSSCSNSQHYVNSRYTFFWYTLYPIHYLQHMFFLPISVMFFWYHLSEHLLYLLCFFQFFHEKCTFPPRMPLTITRSYDKVTSVFVSSRNQTSISIIHTLFSCTSLFPPDY